MRLRCLVIVSVCLVLIGCWNRQDPAAFRYPIETDPPTLDHTFISDHVSFEVLYALQEGLTRHDENLNVIPGLAESWTLTPDRKIYTFHLRKAYWNDGAPITAQQFVDAWLRLLNPTSAAEYAYYLFDIENAEEWNSGKIADPSLVGLRAIDATTLQVKLNHPASYFPHIPTSVLTAPHRLDNIQKHPKQFTRPEYFLSSGPYRLVEWRHDYRLTLEPNPYYYGGPPRVRRIEFHIIKEDSTAFNLYEFLKLDVALRLPNIQLSQLKKRKDYKSTPILRGYYLGFNVTTPPFDKPEIRKALAHAMDRETLVQALQGGQLPTTSWVPKGMFGYEPEVGLSYNPTLAKQLLIQSGLKGGAGFPKTQIFFDSSELNRAVAEKIQFFWKKVLNIDVSIVTEEWKVYLDHLTHDPPGIFRMGWGADYPDPHNFLSLFTSTSGNNNLRWKNKEYDTLVEKGARESDGFRRNQIYKRAQELLLEKEAVIIPLFQTTTEALIQPRIQGFRFDSLENPRFLSASIQ